MQKNLELSKIYVIFVIGKTTDKTKEYENQERTDY